MSQFRISLRPPSPSSKPPAPTPSTGSLNPSAIIKQFLFGNVAHAAKLNNPNGTAGPPSGRIEWCVYVRGFDHRDALPWISSVTFHLHESYSESVVRITSPPYCCSRLGWGVFEVKIEMELFTGDTLTFFHTLDFPDPSNLRHSKRTCRETLDEIVFLSPTPSQLARLSPGSPSTDFRSNAMMPRWSRRIVERFSEGGRGGGGVGLGPRSNRPAAALALERRALKKIEEFEGRLRRALEKEERLAQGQGRGQG